MLQRSHTKMVKNGASSNKTKFTFFRDYESLRASKSLFWLQSYGDFAKWVDFAYWWSCIGTGLRLQPAQQACLQDTPIRAEPILKYMAQLIEQY